MVIQLENSEFIIVYENEKQTFITVFSLILFIN